MTPLFILFILANMLVLLSKSLQAKHGINGDIITIANILFLVLHIAVLLFQKNALNNSNPNVFIRSVMGGMMFKMFICAIAVIAYVSFAGPGYNKPAVFISLILYLFYLAAEVMILLQVNRSKKNA